MTFQELFIINLKKQRKQRKISQLQLAEQCQSSQTYIAEIEVGKKFPSPEMIERIAAVFKVESYLLFQDFPEMPDDPKTSLSSVQKRKISDKIHTAVMEIVDTF